MPQMIRRLFDRWRRRPVYWGSVGGHQPKRGPADVARMLRRLPKGPAPGAKR